jgi:isopentenyl phosphate kinase
MPTAAIRAALDANLVPVVYGDVVFDRARGGGIASTEMIFSHLAGILHPRRILLASIERGVFEDYPGRKKLLPIIRTGEWDTIRSALEGSIHTDVTGGMLTKIQTMLTLLLQVEELEAFVFSGEGKGNVLRALLGESIEGTRLEK